MPWQSGMTGIIYRKDKVEAPAEVRQRPVRPDVQGQGHVADRDARHGRARDRLAGRRPREGHARPGMKAIDKLQEGVDGPDPPLHRQRVHQGHPEGRLVGRSSAGPATRCSSRPTTRTSSSCCRRGRHAVDGQHADPGRRAARVHGREVHRLRLRARGPGADRGVRQLRLPGERASRRSSRRTTRSSPRTS